MLYGSAVNGRNAAGATPLHLALEGGRRAAAHFLLEHGADINAQGALQDAVGGFKLSINVRKVRGVLASRGC